MTMIHAKRCNLTIRQKLTTSKNKSSEILHPANSTPSFGRAGSIGTERPREKATLTLYHNQQHAWSRGRGGRLTTAAVSSSVTEHDERSCKILIRISKWMSAPFICHTSRCVSRFATTYWQPISCGPRLHQTCIVPALFVWLVSVRRQRS